MMQVYIWPSGTYKGEVLDGLRHGCGRLTLADSGVIYEGQWRHGKRHGRGVLSYNSNRKAYYEGKLLLAATSPTAFKRKPHAAILLQPSCAGCCTVAVLGQMLSCSLKLDGGIIDMTPHLPHTYMQASGQMT